jgi:hypothetical protein
MDELSEDWVSQPRSSSSPVSLKKQDTQPARQSLRKSVSAANDLQTSQARPSRIPVRKGQTIEHAKLRNRDAEESVLSERSFSAINIDSLRTNVIRDLGRDNKGSIQRGRRLSGSDSGSVVALGASNGTVQHRSFSSSPHKSGNKAQTPEWKRRLLGEQGDGIANRDLFQPLGLENAFRPPTKKKKQVVVRPDIVEMGGKGSRQTTTSGKLEQSASSESIEEELSDPASVDSLGDSNVFVDRNNEGSMISLPKTTNKLSNIRHEASLEDDDSTALNGSSQPSSQPLSQRCSDYAFGSSPPSSARQNSGINLGDDTIESRQADSSAAFEPEFQSTSPGNTRLQTPPRARRFPHLSGEVPPAAPSPPIVIRTPDGQEESELESKPSKPSGSPLRLFGNYDTFTNHRLMARITQMEDSLQPQEGDLILKPTRKVKLSERLTRRLERLQSQESRGPPSFGDGKLRNFQFRSASLASLDSQGERVVSNPFLTGIESMSKRLGTLRRSVSLGSSIPNTDTMQRQNRPQTRLVSRLASSVQRRTHSSETGYVSTEGTPEADSLTHTPPHSPPKDRSIKRRRVSTMLSDDEDLATFDDEGVKAAQRSSSIIGKRKDALDGDVRRNVDPETMLKRKFLQPRHGRNQSSGGSQKDMPNEREASNPKFSQQPRSELELPKRYSKTNFDVLKSQLPPASQNSTVNGSRKASVTTQDYLDEALKIMTVLREYGRPKTLTPLKEAEPHPEEDLQSDDEHINADESTEEDFLRPPSREGAYTSVMRNPNKVKHSDTVENYLKLYQEQSDVEDMTVNSRLWGSKSSKEDLRSTGQTEPAFAQKGISREEAQHSEPPNVRIFRRADHESHKNVPRSPTEQTGSMSSGMGAASQPSTFASENNDSAGTNISARSENVRTIAPSHVAHLVQKPIAGMSYDAATHRWIRAEDSEKGAIDKDSERDPFEGISDLSVDDKKLSNGKQSLSGPSQLRNPVTLEEKATDIAPESSISHSLFSGYTSGAPRTETLASSWASDTVSRKAYVQAKEHEREVAEEWNEEDLPDVEDLPEMEDEFDFSKIAHPSRTPRQKTPGPGRRTSVAFSSPLVSMKEFERDESTPSSNQSVIRSTIYEEEPSGMDTFLVPSESASRPSRSFRNKFGAIPYQSPLSQRMSELKLTRQPSSPVQTRRELSTISENEGTRQLSLVLHTPQEVEPISAPMISTPASVKSQHALRLTPLADFTIYQDDCPVTLDVSFVEKGRAELNHRGIQRNIPIATEEIVRRLTDLEPYEAYWDDIREVRLNGQSLSSLHSLDEFCPKIERLDVSNNQLRHLEGIPPAVRSLNLGKNCLSPLTGWNHLRNLQYLDISSNKIQSLIGLQSLIHLRELVADDNEVSSLEGVQELDGLLKLRMRRNHLETADFSKANLYVIASEM